ncbi:hypothetical protein [Haloglycomyces albus]|uniref:hypothetical protein n=1 Tax=Haloglycomyces albus TaxID=526067 RepID=UPI00046D1A24|nr:hypothetical protein [Haloglycomyces albus]
MLKKALATLIGPVFVVPVLIGTTAALTSPAQPAVAQEDETCDGVTVVVEFPDGDSERGCAADPSDGLDALRQAGFTVTEVSSQPGMVCRINALPDTSCSQAPPPEDYWSYWTADPGDSAWDYSPAGPTVVEPEAGSAQGWAFGAGDEPSDAPSTASADESASDDTASNSGADDEDENGKYWWLVAPMLVIALILLTLAVKKRRDDE